MSIPPGLRASEWFTFDGGYQPVSQLLPGKAYWVKASGAGEFVLIGQSAAKDVGMGE